MNRGAAVVGILLLPVVAVAAVIAHAALTLRVIDFADTVPEGL